MLIENGDTFYCVDALLDGGEGFYVNAISDAGDASSTIFGQLVTKFDKAVAS